MELHTDSGESIFTADSSKDEPMFSSSMDTEGLADTEPSMRQLKSTDTVTTRHSSDYGFTDSGLRYQRSTATKE